MKAILSKITFTASLVFAMAFTFTACSSGDDPDDNGGSTQGGSSKGNDIANYKTVTIGSQTWMAENLNYNVAGSKCYRDSVGNCNKYGRLYDWSTAKTVCPSGWHLPSKEEWDTLADFVESDKGCNDCAGKHLKATSGWNSNGNGLDSYGFAALPGGYSSSVAMLAMPVYDGNWWSASEHNADYAYYRGMRYDVEYASWSYNDKTLLFSVRCLQD